jgi:hypothetical protein
VWREVEVVGVGNVASLFFVRAFVWGDVDPHSGGLGAGEPDGSVVASVVKIIRDCCPRDCSKRIHFTPFSLVFSGVHPTPSLVVKIKKTQESTPIIWQASPMAARL